MAVSMSLTFLAYFPVFIFIFMSNVALVHSTSQKDFGTKSEQTRPWYASLFWNLLGYATIIIPGAFIIRAVKNSTFNESGGEFYDSVRGFFFCLIWPTIFVCL